MNLSDSYNIMKYHACILLQDTVKNYSAVKV